MDSNRGPSVSIRHDPSRAPFGMRPALGALIWFALWGIGVIPVRAAALVPNTTYTVTKTADTADTACNADCSLREAVLAANLSPGADTIIIPAGVYNLTRTGAAEDAAATGDLDIMGMVTITGAGASTTTIDGQATDRVFHILAGANVTLSGVTVRNGMLADAGGGILNEGTLSLNDGIIAGNTATGSAGGGIANRGVLNMNNVKFQANESTFGGGIYSESGGNAITLTNSILDGNRADFGGGVYTRNGTVGITATVFVSNTANNSGGAIDNYTGNTLTLFSSTVRENTAAVYGGGIFVEDGQMTVNASAIISNSVRNLGDVSGGGIFNWGVLTITNSTISGNTAYADNTCGAGGCSTNYRSSGGGIYNYWPLTMVNSTVNLNAAWYRGGYAGYPAGKGAGLYNVGIAQLKNTIIANSRGYQTAEAGNCTGSFTAVTSNGYNLDSGYSCGFASLGDKVSVDPLLGPLHTYGTTPPVHPLQSGSQAIDGGSSDAVQCPTVDQRGFARPFDGDANGTATCDIGAFEYGYYTSSVALASSVNPSAAGQSVTLTATVSSAQGNPTGTVTFKDGSTIICSAAAIAAGKATCAAAFSSPGVHAITAVYSGDDWFSTSTGTLVGGQTVNAVVPSVFRLFLPMELR